MVGAVLAMYEGLVLDGVYQKDKLQGCSQLNTLALIPYGLKRDGDWQSVCGAQILPKDYLCPYADATGVLNITEHTVSIHWFSKSPHGKWAAWKVAIMRPLRRWMKNL